jgi:L-2-hydroxycarboxylate dehydrogenase (NAD+)
MNSDKFIIDYKDLKLSIIEIFSTIGMNKEDAELVANVLVEAELRGIPSHGLVRVKDYLGLWQKNRLNINAKPQIIKESLATGLVDGDNGLGMISGDFAMNLAISKAQNAGCGVVVKSFKSSLVKS